MTTNVDLGPARDALRGASSEGAHVVTDAPVDPGEHPAPTSLVLTNQSVADGGDGCPTPRDGFRLLNLDTRELRPVGCGRQKCPGCGPYCAWRRALAIGFVRPERQLEFTLVGDTFDAIRPRMKDARYRLLEAGVRSLEWSWHVEPNPAGTGHHVHAWQHGDFIPQTLLSAVARRVGFGEVTHIQRFRQKHEAVGYGLKGAGYGLKGAARAESLADYMLANGGRLSHHSRGFYRGRPVREVERDAITQLRGGESPWVVVTVDELHRQHAVRPAALRG